MFENNGLLCPIRGDKCSHACAWLMETDCEDGVETYSCALAEIAQAMSDDKAWRVCFVSRPRRED